MQCLVINLDRSPQRLAHISAMFDGMGVAFTRVRAHDGVALPQESIDQINALNRWFRPLTRAEVGCLLSHRDCWQRIAAAAAPFGAVFEDDVRISPRARSLLQSSQWIPPGTDFIKLETRNRAVIVSRKSRQVAGGQLVRLFSFHDGLGGYIVSRACARRLCLEAEKTTAPVDQLILNPQLGIFAKLDVLQLTPAICTPGQSIDGGEQVAELSSTIDTEGNLYRSDQSRLRQPTEHGWLGRARRETARMAARLHRLRNGQKKTRVPFQ